jgi:hypothetical protein
MPAIEEEGRREKKEKKKICVCLLGTTGGLVPAINLMVVPTGRRFERFCPLQLSVMSETKVGQ